jgi:cardiolipin synthase
VNPVERSSSGNRRARGLTRLLGLRRGGEDALGPPLDADLRPLTIPNVIGYVRVILLGAFLAIALPSDDGRVAGATACFAAAAGLDYIDGLTARLTGQYSRLGKLMDPLIDRAVVVSGILVNWKFELLPRWALGALAAREILMVLVAGAGLLKGLEIEINWVGRLAVWPTMAAVGGALLTDVWLVDALLYVGLVGGLVATALYIRDGLRLMRRAS